MREGRRVRIAGMLVGLLSGVSGVAWSLPGPGPAKLDVSALLREVDVNTLHRAGAAARDDEAGAGPQLLGLEASLPVEWLRTSVEYSVVAPESASELQSHDDHSLLRVQLDKRWSSAAVGLRYFSVGEAFARESVGGGRLSQFGLPKHGQGTEAWARWTVHGLTLKPRVRQVTSSRGTGEHAEDRLVLAAEREIVPALRLAYQYEAVVSEVDVGAALAAANRTELDRHQLRLANDDWNLVWTHRHKDVLAGQSAPPRQELSRELSARVALSPRLTVAPSVSREEILSLAAAPVVRDAGSLNLSYGTEWRWIPELDLRLGYEGIERELETRRSLRAGLNFRTLLDLGWAPPERTFLDVSLSYQQITGSSVPDDAGGVELKLTLEHRPGS